MDSNNTKPLEKTDNEIIAEFMGMRRQEPGEYNKTSYWRPDERDKRKRGVFMGYFDSLEYHESWDWLMPVVRKILQMVSGTNIGQFTIDDRYDAAYKAGVITKNLTFADINSVYHSVVEFIKWYNKNKKP